MALVANARKNEPRARLIFAARLIVPLVSETLPGAEGIQTDGHRGAVRSRVESPLGGLVRPLKATVGGGLAFRPGRLSISDKWKGPSSLSQLKPVVERSLRLRREHRDPAASTPGRVLLDPSENTIRRLGDSLSWVGLKVCRSRQQVSAVGWTFERPWGELRCHRRMGGRSLAYD
jgi:hypothetical protein